MIQDFFKKGFVIGWLGLFILAGGIPIAPFSFFGYSGLNLMAAGAPVWAAGKAASQGASYLLSRMINLYVPALWPVANILNYSPWYVFDVVQMFSPTFADEGFKLPLTHKTVGQVGSHGTITPVVLAAIVGLFSAGAYNLLQYLPKEITRGAKPLLEKFFLIVGSATAMAGGGMGAYAVLPQVLSALRGGEEKPTAPTPTKASTASAPTKAITAPTPTKASVAPKPYLPSGPSASIDLPKPPSKDTSVPQNKIGLNSAVTTLTGVTNTMVPDVATNLTFPENDKIMDPGLATLLKGGGASGNPGSTYPSLRSIADGMLGASESGDPAPYPGILPKTMAGGGASDSALPFIFLGLLALPAVAGLTLGAVRSKQGSRI